MSVSSPNSIILDTRSDANLLGAHQETFHTPAPSSPFERATTGPEETRDTRREFELTPGEVHAAYLELNGQITVQLDIYVGQLAKATTDFKALLPLLDMMHSMLSQRGPKLAR